MRCDATYREWERRVFCRGRWWPGSWARWTFVRRTANSRTRARRAPRPSSICPPWVRCRACSDTAPVKMTLKTLNDVDSCFESIIYLRSIASVANLRAHNRADCRSRRRAARRRGTCSRSRSRLALPSRSRPAAGSPSWCRGARCDWCGRSWRTWRSGERCGELRARSVASSSVCSLLLVVGCCWWWWWFKRLSSLSIYTKRQSLTVEFAIDGVLCDEADELVRLHDLVEANDVLVLEALHGVYFATQPQLLVNVQAALLEHFYCHLCLLQSIAFQIVACCCAWNWNSAYIFNSFTFCLVIVCVATLTTAELPLPIVMPSR